MPEKTFYESLKCILTDDEKQKLGSDMAEAVARIAEAEADLKSFQTQIKAKVAADEAIVMTCSEKIRSGYEFRRIECEEFKDFESNKILISRLDTHEIIKERPMEPEERQKDLPLDNEEETAEVMENI